MDDLTPDDMADGAPPDLPADATMTYKSAEAPLHLFDERPAGAGEVADPATGAPTIPSLDCTLRRMLGVGGQGEIWEAWQHNLYRRVAVKRMRGHAPGETNGHDRDELARRAFQQEAITAANLEHPNIAPVHQLGTDETGRPVLMMKLVHGRPWSEVIAEDSESPAWEFFAKHINILIQVGQAVAFAHSQGVIHRDLKPSQVMLGEFGEVLLMDWGLSVTRDSPDRQDDRPLPQWIRGLLGTMSNPAGTPAYMAPEQTELSLDSVGEWTDIYLLGGILYFLLTRTPPHNEPNPRIAFLMAKAGVVEEPELRRPGAEIPLRLKELAMRAMAAKPAERVPSAAAFVADLRDYLSGAGDRRESEKIVRDIRERLAAGPVGYSVFADFISSLSRAEGLWPANGEIADLRESLSEGYARDALGNGDLMLAEAHANRLGPGGARRALLADIEASRKRMRKAATERRFAMWAAALFVVLLLGGAVKYARDQAAARATSEHARNDAMAQKKEAEIARTDAAMHRELAEQGWTKAVGEKEAALVEQYFSGIGFADSYIHTGRPNKARDTLLDKVPGKLRNWEWGRLMAMTAADDMVMAKGTPQKEMHHAAYSPDGTRIVTGQRSGAVTVWDSSTGRRLAVWDAFPKGVWATRFSPDGKRILATSFAGEAKILDASTGTELAKLKGLAGGELVMRGGGFSPDGRRVATTGYDRFLRIWDATDGRQLLQTRLPYPTYDADFSPDGSTVAVAMTGQGQAAICATSSGQVLRMLPGHTKSVYSARFSADGKRVLTASLDQSARIFDAATGELVTRLVNPDSGLYCAVFDPEGRRAATIAEDGSVRVWDAVSGKESAHFDGAPGTACIAFHPTQNKVLSTAYSEVRQWDVGRFDAKPAAPAAKGELSPGMSLTRATASSFPMDRLSIWGDQDKPWLDGGGRSFWGSGNNVYAVDSFYRVFSPNGENCIAIDYSSFTATLLVGGVSQPATVFQLKSVYCAGFSHSGEMAFTGTFGGKMQLWDTRIWKEIASFGDDATNALWCGAFSPDDSSLVLGWQNGAITIWNIAERRPRSAFQAHATAKPVVSISFTTDGTRFVSASSDQTAKVWETATARLVSTLEGHEKFLLCASFSPDGSRVVTASNDDQVKLWESATGREIMTVVPRSGVRRLVGAGFNHDGTRIFFLTGEKQLFEVEALPWSDTAYPGAADVDFLKRLELVKRRAHMSEKIGFDDIGW